MATPRLVGMKCRDGANDVRDPWPAGTVSHFSVSTLAHTKAPAIRPRLAPTAPMNRLASLGVCLDAGLAAPPIAPTMPPASGIQSGAVRDHFGRTSPRDSSSRDS